ncbi:MAG: hypothetical protein DCC75_11815 [Proteobacteria bacterium]|nr:MAG: hypothetical protein DCC75_11815 [Pseudomonadota bacterium]
MPHQVEGQSASYKASEYEDASYEQLGQQSESLEFTPLEVPIIRTTAEGTDPMFADFGGQTPANVKQRWHLPEHLSLHAKEIEEQRKKEEEAKIRLSPEEFEALKAKEFERGRQQGTQEAVEQGSERLSHIESRLETVLKDIAVQVKEHGQEIEKQAVELALMIGKKLVDQAVEINPEYLIPIINEALKLAGGAGVMKIRISPQDMEFVELVGISKRIKDFDGSWSFESDATIKSGCVIETSAGQIDYQLDLAWERIRDNVVRIIK